MRELGQGNPPPLRTLCELKRHAAIAAEWCRNHPGEDFDPAISDNKGVTGRSALFDLSYFDPIAQCTLDMMHLTSGITGRHLVRLMTKGVKEGAGEQSARKAIAARKRMTPAQLAAEEDAPRWRAVEKEKKEAEKVQAAKDLQHKRDLAIRKAKKGSKRLADLLAADQKRKRNAAAKLAKQQEASARMLAQDVKRSDYDRPADAVSTISACGEAVLTAYHSFLILLLCIRKQSNCSPRNGECRRQPVLWWSSIAIVASPRPTRWLREPRSR
jgi:hypothetical protein